MDSEDVSGLENHGNERYDDGGHKSAIDETAIGTEPRDAVEGDPSNGEENIFEAVYVNEQLTTSPQGKINIEMGNPRLSPPCTQRLSCSHSDAYQPIPRSDTPDSSLVSSQCTVANIFFKPNRRCTSYGKPRYVSPHPAFQLSQRTTNHRHR